MKIVQNTPELIHHGITRLAKQTTEINGGHVVRPTLVVIRAEVVLLIITIMFEPLGRLVPAGEGAKKGIGEERGNLALGEREVLRGGPREKERETKVGHELG